MLDTIFDIDEIIMVLNKTEMKTKIQKLDTGSIKSFVSENKMLIAAIGGITVGITLASLMGNERARQLLRTMGSTLADASGKVVDNFGSYKHLIAPLLSKINVQGV